MTPTNDDTRAGAVEADRMEARAFADWFAAMPPELRSEFGIGVRTVADATLLLAPRVPSILVNRAIGLRHSTTNFQPNSVAMGRRRSGLQLCESALSRYAHGRYAGEDGSRGEVSRARERARLASVGRSRAAAESTSSGVARRIKGCEPERRSAPRAYFHSQALLFVLPSASALYSKTTATAFRRRKFGESL